MSHLKRVYLVDGVRTPFLKSKNKPGPFSASDLASFAGRCLFLKQKKLEPSMMDNVILGCAMPSSLEPNIGRYASLRIGCLEKTPAYTVMRNCATGLQAIDSACMNIQSKGDNLILAGGTDVLSRAPLSFNNKFVDWFCDLAKLKSAKNKILHLLKFKIGFLNPEITLLNALSEPTTGENMGHTVERLADIFNISREEMDDFSLSSHLKAAKFIKSQAFDEEVAAVYDFRGNVYDTDTGVRDNSSIAQLSKLKTIYDRAFGRVTAGNSSQVTDGASMAVIASEEAVEKHNINPIARIVDIQWAALDPGKMGLGPVHAMSKLLKANNLESKDIGLWEINEAFAAQVLACLKAWTDKDYCSSELGLDRAWDPIPKELLNIHGGAIALGHPVSASGARLTVALAKNMKRSNIKYGVASLCIGGGLGGAVLLEGMNNA